MEFLKSERMAYLEGVVKKEEERNKFNKSKKQNKIVSKIGTMWYTCFLLFIISIWLFHRIEQILEKAYFWIKWRNLISYINMILSSHNLQFAGWVVFTFYLSQPLSIFFISFTFFEDFVSRLWSFLSEDSLDDSLVLFFNLFFLAQGFSIEHR